MDVEMTLYDDVREHIRMSILNKQPSITETQQLRQDDIAVHLHKETTW